MFTIGMSRQRLVWAAVLGVMASGSQAQESGPVLEEVIVTGQKFNRSVQDTPQSVTVIDAQILQEENLLTLSDVLYRTPNAVSAFNGTGFSLRGVRNDNVSGGGSSDLATIFLDGAPLPRDLTFVGTLDTWDLEQVEVLRGPQSTLQGRNSLAGAIIMQTADPSFEREGRARAQYLDETQEQRYSIAFGAPIIKDQLAFRIAGEITESNGVMTNITLNDDKIGGNEVDMIRTKVLIAPEALPELEVMLSHMYDDREFGQRISRAEDPYGFDNRVDFSNRAFSDRAETDLYTANIRYDLSETFDLALISTYSEVERSSRTDGDLTAVDANFATTESETKTITTELRLTFDTDRLSGVAGFWYSNIDVGPTGFRTVFNFDMIEQFQLPLLLQGAPFLLDETTALIASNFYTDPFTLDARINAPIKTETYAVFADVTYELMDRTDLLAGFRYDVEEQDQFRQQVVVVASEFPDPASAGPLAPVIFGVNGFLQAQADQANTPGTQAGEDFNQFLPKFGASYRLTDEQTLSLIIQRGYRSGGVSVNAAQAVIVPFDEETTWNYELSYRSRWLDSRLTLNANLFYTDWEDQQVSVRLSSNSFDQQTENAGESELWGFEIDTAYALTDNLEIYAALGYTDTEFNDFIQNINGEDVNLSGNEFSQAPNWTLSGGASWTHSFGWIVNVNANYTSDSYNAVLFQEEAPDVPERTLVNFRAGWQGDNIGVYLIGRNIFDEDYQDAGAIIDSDGNNLARYGEPQNFGLTVEANL